MHKNFKVTILIFALFLVLPLSVFAHPGRTDANGCHTDKKTGAYHCHNTPTTIENKDARTEARQSANVQARNENSISGTILTETIQQVAVEEKYLVSRVIDGDTIELSNGTKVRYIGIDTPETVDPRKTVQCFGVEANNRNKQLVEGKEVRLEKDVSDIDKYGRLLRYVYVNGVFVNLVIVQEGFAYSYTYPPDVKYQSKFVEAEKLAREQKKGLWGSCSTSTQSSITLITPKTSTTTTQLQGTCNIKGNINSTKEKIYHLIGCGSYNQTKIDEVRGERWFCTEEEAITAGWRKAKNCP